MGQIGDAPLKPAGQVREVGHDQQEDDDGGAAGGIRGRRLRAWRETVRRRPLTNRLYRLAVGLAGTVIIVVGLVLVPLPGPGWLIVFVGLAVLATEFTWAARLEQFARKQVAAWTQWLLNQPLYVRALVALGTSVLVAGFFYLTFLVIGVPGIIPADWIPQWSGLESSG